MYYRKTLVFSCQLNDVIPGMEEKTLDFFFFYYFQLMALCFYEVMHNI